ncbi:MAG: N-acetylmuramoyl-L-alanine amidase [Candidatus Cloacimonetes bacterium]|nr:N-acetylmuramoyl-L-alanine amidase [Candidatus Cloacimonadota bacterium]
MKKIMTLALLLLAFGMLSADISVQIRGASKVTTLKEATFSSKRYVDLDDFSTVFKAINRQDRCDGRIFLHLYDEQFIFLEGSPYYTYKTESFNMHYSLLRKGAKLYLPSLFVTVQLHTHFAKEVEMKAKILTIDKPRDNSITTIVLDPGHGGKDPGAVGRKLKAKEKDINLGVCLKLKSLLEKELGLRVLLTRSDDRFVSLQDRTKYANEKKADLFVSLHTNSSKSASGKGLETYYLSTAQTSEARAVEALENDVVELFEGGTAAKRKYDDLAFILSDLSQTENLESSNQLASNVQQNIVAGTRATDRGVKQANFYVLRGAFMPSILVEMGFLSNEEEEQLLVNEEYQDRLARTIFEGIKRFKFRYDRIRNT